MLGHPVGILAKPKFARTGSRTESSKAAHILDSGRVSFSPFEEKHRRNDAKNFDFIGAGDEYRTRDPQLGKLMLYH
jgi:hypothetical protein